jgi:hypothetical protein
MLDPEKAQEKADDKFLMCIELQTGIDFIGSFLIADMLISGIDTQSFWKDEETTWSFKFVYVAFKIPILISLGLFASYWYKDCIRSRHNLTKACCIVAMG